MNPWSGTHPDQGFNNERVKGIEPSLSAWEADVLPLNYTRVRDTVYLVRRNGARGL
jgi:hypothetical protein